MDNTEYSWIGKVEDKKGRIRSDRFLTLESVVLE